jgi:hypothetical protein
MKRAQGSPINSRSQREKKGAPPCFLFLTECYIQIRLPFDGVGVQFMLKVPV